MASPPSSLSRRGFLAGTGTLGAATSVGRAATTTPASDASRPDWSLDAPDAENFEPELTADGSVYAFARTDAKGTGPAERSLLAVDAATGERRWSYDLPSIVLGPILVDGTLYVSAVDSVDDDRPEWRLIAIDAVTGDRSWRTMLTNDFVPLPAVEPGTVLLTRKSGLVALDAESGGRKWTFREPRDAFGRSVIVGSMAYVGAANGVFAVLTDDGTKQWQSDSWESQRPAVLAADDDYVYCADEESVFALVAGDGEIAWSHPFSGYPRTLLDDGTLYCWTDETLHAVDVGGGTVRWTYDEPGGIGTGLTLADGALFATVDDDPPRDEFHVVNVDDGSQRWSMDLPGSPTGRSWGGVHDGVAYVVERDGLVARDAADGTERWTFETDERPHGAAFGDDTLVFGTEASLYGFDLAESGLASLADDATTFLGSTAGLALSGLVVGTGALAAYRRLNDDADDHVDGDSPADEQMSDGESADADATDDEPEPEFGRLERLDSDAVTETYRVRERTPDGSRVVVETRLTDPALAEPFRASVARWAHLDDRDGVVPVLDHDDERVVAPVLDGSLADADRPFEDRVHALSDANLTVHRAHDDGILHGGVTPSAIRLDGDDALVGDWELGAALVDHREPSPFDAPEQRNGSGTVDERTDVYRLGATAAAVLDVDAVDDVTDASASSERSDDLERVLATATATDPADRYGSVVKFDDMLRWAALRS
ncbi:outer membrane protein assembly factor BamB family protein [Halomicrococcus gelatinilyticus]|uniref:outer membrane protein assembly factor BamB family protein n=1 Tax=Halomicrococcus gelatinilyticus TaxID=1702103 RepID=UPI002E12AF06